MASGSISLGDQRITTYTNVLLTNIGGNSIAPRNVVINKPGLYFINITNNTTTDANKYWHGMCVIYKNGDMYYCKGLGGVGESDLPYIYQSNLNNIVINIGDNNGVVSNTTDWVNAPTDIGGGGFRIGAQGGNGGTTVTIMIFFIG